MSAVKLPPLTDGIVAARAVLGDLIEDATGVRDLSCAGGDPVLRRQLEDELVTEVMLLAETHDERAAVRAEPRPGKWYGDGDWADGRELTQRQTDVLIVCELYDTVDAPRQHGRTIEDLIGPFGVLELPLRDHMERAARQRGGIACDPLVRLIAWRTWGGRDISAYWGIDRSVHINRVEIGARDPDRFIADLTNSFRSAVDHTGRLRRG